MSDGPDGLEDPDRSQTQQNELAEQVLHVLFVKRCNSQHFLSVSTDVVEL